MNAPEEKKLIIDEDWKSQVEAEKEVLRQQEENQQTGDVEKQEPLAEEPLAEELPPASFVTHVMSLATQATMALGQIPDPEKPDEPPPVNLMFAKYVVDTISMLDEKTRGNLTTEEAAMMENLLHQLRIVYLEVERQDAS